MKFVYVLVSSENDYYTEEALISMFSLKKYNPNSTIVTITDEETYKRITEKKPEISQYINEFIIPILPPNLSNIQKSRFLKTSIRKHIKGSFLYIDNDTIITSDLKDLDEFDYDLGAVLNMHRKEWESKNPHSMVLYYNKHCRKDLLEEYPITQYFNGGIIFSKDTPLSHDFFNLWHKLWLDESINLGFHKDQITMWKANFILGDVIKELEPEYNCQIIYPIYAFPYLKNCKILHYFSSSKQASHIKLKNKYFLEKIRNKGITDEIKLYLDNFTIEFISGLLILMDDDRRYYNTPASLIAKKISKKIPFINSFLQKSLNLYGTLFK